MRRLGVEARMRFWLKFTTILGSAEFRPHMYTDVGLGPVSEFQPYQSMRPVFNTDFFRRHPNDRRMGKMFYEFKSRSSRIYVGSDFTMRRMRSYFNVIANIN